MNDDVPTSPNNGSLTERRYRCPKSPQPLSPFRVPKITTVVVISSGAAKKAAGGHFKQGLRQILGRRNKRSSPAKITEKIFIA